LLRQDVTSFLYLKRCERNGSFQGSEITILIEDPDGTFPDVEAHFTVDQGCPIWRHRDLIGEAIQREGVISPDNTGFFPAKQIGKVDAAGEGDKDMVFEALGRGCAGAIVRAVVIPVHPFFQDAVRPREVVNSGDGEFPGEAVLQKAKETLNLASSLGFIGRGASQANTQASQSGFYNGDGLLVGRGDRTGMSGRAELTIVVGIEGVKQPIAFQHPLYGLKVRFQGIRWNQARIEDGSGVVIQKQDERIEGGVIGNPAMSGGVHLNQHSCRGSLKRIPGFASFTFPLLMQTFRKQQPSDGFPGKADTLLVQFFHKVRKVERGIALSSQAQNFFPEGFWNSSGRRMPPAVFEAVVSLLLETLPEAKGVAVRKVKDAGGLAQSQSSLLNSPENASSSHYLNLPLKR